MFFLRDNAQFDYLNYPQIMHLNVMYRPFAYMKMQDIASNDGLPVSANAGKLGSTEIGSGLRNGQRKTISKAPFDDGRTSSATDAGALPRHRRRLEMDA